MHSSASGTPYINDNCENKRAVALNYCLLNQGGKLRARVYLTALLRRANHANYELECLRSSSLNCRHRSHEIRKEIGEPISRIDRQTTYRISIASKDKELLMVHREIT